MTTPAQKVVPDATAKETAEITYRQGPRATGWDQRAVATVSQRRWTGQQRMCYSPAQSQPRAWREAISWPDAPKPVG